MARPTEEGGSAPRSLKPEDTAPQGPTAPTGPMSYPSGVTDPSYQPTTKEEADEYKEKTKNHYEAWRRSNLELGIPVKVSSGVVYHWEEGGGSEGPPPEVVAEGEDAVRDWHILNGQEEGGGSGKWVPDPTGQMFYDDWQIAGEMAKGNFAGSGAAAAYVDTETPKSKEIQRQWRDFEDRATAYYGFLEDEQEYGMRADDQNWQNMQAQKDFGLASIPYYTQRPMSSALSNIVGPSLPDYVRPDYRLNGLVGLPGAQGFDDPDYDEFGFPRFAFGTDAPNGGIAVPPLKPTSWPWGGR